jgi:hypothetical protein
MIRAGAATRSKHPAHARLTARRTKGVSRSVLRAEELGLRLRELLIAEDSSLA